MSTPLDQYSLHGRTALVLGATGRLGTACSRILSSSGAGLILQGRDRLKLDALLAELPGSAGLGHSFDGLNTEGFFSTLDALPSPDILVCAMGPFLSASLDETATADWSSLAALNLALPGSLISHCLPPMLGKGYGRILLFGSTRGDQDRGFRKTAAYAASKAGLAVLARSIALEYGKKGVSCSVFCPGVLEGSEHNAPGGSWKALPAGDLAIEALRAALHPEALYNGAVIAADGGLDAS